MRKDMAERLARVALGGQQRDLGMGMMGEQADEFGAGIAAGAENADPDAIRCLCHGADLRRYKSDEQKSKKGAPERGAQV